MESVRKLVQSLQIFPGVGKKTAEKYALTLLEKKTTQGIQLGQELISTLSNITYCKQCHFFCDNDPLCDFCNDPHRNHNQILVVHHAFDVMHIEKLHSYHGLYHILGGQLSPIERIGPDQLTIQNLFERIQKNAIEEVILGTNANIEGEATAHYIAQHIKKNHKNITITRLASGVPLGSELEYIDTHTLSYALSQRKAYDSSE